MKDLIEVKIAAQRDSGSEIWREIELNDRAEQSFFVSVNKLG